MYMYCESLLGSIILHVIFNLCGILIIPKLVAINPAIGYIILILGILCLVFSLFKIMKKYETILYEE